MRRALFVSVAIGLSALSSAHAQRPAISSELSPHDAAVAFEAALVEACIPAVTQGRRLDALPSASGYAVTTRAETRRQANAEAGDTVWEALMARGVVTVTERAGRCVVQVYGAPTTTTVLAASQRLKRADMGFEAMMAAGGGPFQTLMRMQGGKRIQVILRTSEPGMPGHQSRFPVVTATVSELQ